jgi:hypothetical protein
LPERFVRRERVVGDEVAEGIEDVQRRPALIAIVVARELGTTTPRG